MITLSYLLQNYVRESFWKTDEKAKFIRGRLNKQSPKIFLENDHNFKTSHTFSKQS